MHYWGDKNVDWEGITEAAYYIGFNLRRYGRITVTDMKEKYGTVRVYCYFGWSSIYDMYYNHGYYNNKSKFLNWFDDVVFYKVSNLLNKVLIPYQKIVYKYYYGQALKKWPHLKGEILYDCDHPELLTKYGIKIEKDSNNFWTISIPSLEKKDDEE